MSIKITTDKYPQIIELYNTEGRTAAYDFMRSRYGLKHPTPVMKRLKADKSLGYNYETDRFETSAHLEEDIFMNLEELCENTAELSGKSADPIRKNDRSRAIENMVHTLISDRLLELSKYVLLDPISRKIFVDQSGMQADGYQVIVH